MAKPTTTNAGRWILTQINYICLSLWLCKVYLIPYVCLLTLTLTEVILVLYVFEYGSCYYNRIKLKLKRFWNYPMFDYNFSYYINSAHEKCHCKLCFYRQWIKVMTFNKMDIYFHWVWVGVIAFRDVSTCGFSERVNEIETVN